MTDWIAQARARCDAATLCDNAPPLGPYMGHVRAILDRPPHQGAERAEPPA